MRPALPALLLLLALPAAPAAAHGEGEGLSCEAWGGTYAGHDAPTSLRLCLVAERLHAIPMPERVERVAQAIGAAGCPPGWPADPFALQAHEARAKGNLVRALGLAADEAAFLANDLDAIYYEATEALAAQGRLVSITDEDWELIPRACAGG